jgi:hypothetical protein
MIEPGFPENEWKYTVPYIEIRMSRMPPVISHFQAIIKNIIIIKTGILCIRNSTILMVKGSLLLNVSSENNSMKRIDRIVRILGIQ